MDVALSIPDGRSAPGFVTSWRPGLTWPVTEAVTGPTTVVASGALLAELNQQQREAGNRVVVGLLVVVMVAGLGGNSLVLAVYGRRRGWSVGGLAGVGAVSRSPAVLYILVMAGLDVASCLLTVPYEILDLLLPYSNDDVHFCRVVRFVTSVLNQSRGFMLLCVALDRYYKICRPLVTYSSQLARLTVLVVLLCGVALSWPLFPLNARVTIATHVPHVQAMDCNVSREVPKGLVLLYHGLMYAIFVFFFLAYGALYGRMFWVLWKEGWFRPPSTPPTCCSRSSQHGQSGHSRGGAFGPVDVPAMVDLRRAYLPVKDSLKVDASEDSDREFSSCDQEQVACKLSTPNDLREGSEVNDHTLSRPRGDRKSCSRMTKTTSTPQPMSSTDQQFSFKEKRKNSSHGSRNLVKRGSGQPVNSYNKHYDRNTLNVSIIDHRLGDIELQDCTSFSSKFALGMRHGRKGKAWFATQGGKGTDLCEDSDASRWEVSVSEETGFSAPAALAPSPLPREQHPRALFQCRAKSLESAHRSDKSKRGKNTAVTSTWFSPNLAEYDYPVVSMVTKGTSIGLQPADKIFDFHKVNIADIAPLQSVEHRAIDDTSNYAQSQEAEGLETQRSFSQGEFSCSASASNERLLPTSRLSHQDPSMSKRPSLGKAAMTPRECGGTCENVSQVSESGRPLCVSDHPSCKSRQLLPENLQSLSHSQIESLPEGAHQKDSEKVIELPWQEDRCANLWCPESKSLELSKRSKIPEPKEISSLGKECSADCDVVMQGCINVPASTFTQDSLEDKNINSLCRKSLAECTDCSTSSGTCCTHCSLQDVAQCTHMCVEKPPQCCVYRELESLDCAQSPGGDKADMYQCLIGQKTHESPRCVVDMRKCEQCSDVRSLSICSRESDVMRAQRFATGVVLSKSLSGVSVFKRHLSTKQHLPTAAHVSVKSGAFDVGSKQLLCAYCAIAATHTFSERYESDDVKCVDNVVRSSLPVTSDQRVPATSADTVEPNQEQGAVNASLTKISTSPTNPTDSLNPTHCSASHKGRCMRRHGGRRLKIGKTTLMLALVTLSAVISLLPCLTVLFLKAAGMKFQDSTSSSGDLVYIFCVRSWLVANVTNPFIYYYINPRFRAQVHQALRRCCCSLRAPGARGWRWLQTKVRGRDG